MRKLLALMLFSALTLPVFSQEMMNVIPPITYNTPGVNGNDKGVDIKLDAAGNAYVLGWIETAAEGVNYIVRKYDNSGAFVYSRTFNSAGAQDDVPASLAVDNAGNAYCTGTIAVGGNPIGIFTAKIDTSGNQVFAVRYDLNSGNLGSTDVGNDIACDQSGNCWIIGESFNGTNRDYVIVKYNTNGTVGWTQTENGPGNGTDRGRAIDLDNGFVYTTGVVFVSATDTDFGNGKYNAATGARSWFTRYTGTQVPDDNAGGFDLDVTPTGKVVCVGERRVNSNQNKGMTGTGIWLNGTTGAVMYPTPANENLGQLMNWNQNDEDTRGYRVAYGTMPFQQQGIEMAYISYDGYVSGNHFPFTGIGATFASDQLINVFTNRQWDHVSTGIATYNNAGGVAVDPKGVGFVATYGVADTNMADGNDRHDVMVFKSLGNGGSGALFTYDGGLQKDDESVACAVDANEDIWVVGSTTVANDKFDIIIFKLQQQPFIIRDEFNIFKGGSVNVDAANGVLKNDVAIQGATVIKDAGIEFMNGTGSIATDGAYTYTPNANFTGTDGISYHINKAPWGDVFSPGGPNGNAIVNVYPNVSSLDIPSTMNGNDYSNGTVNLDGAEPTGFGQTLQGTASCDPPGVILFPYGWGTSGGSNQGFITLSPQGVSADTSVTVTVTRGSSSATDTTTVTPGGIVGIVANPGTLVGGTSSTGTVTLGLPAKAGGQVVNLSTNSTFLSAPATVTVAEGGTTATFAISTSAVTSTATRQVIAKAFGFNDANSVKTGNVVLTPPAKLSSMGLSPASVHGGQNSTLTVTLNSASSGTTAVPISDNSSAIISPASADVPNGSFSVQVPIGTTQVSGTVVRTITGVFGGVSKTVNLTIVQSPLLTNFTISPGVVTGGQSTNGTVTLSGNATSGSINLAIADNSGFISTPTATSVLQGSSTRQFGINTLAVGSSNTRQVTATLLGVVKTANLTLHPSPTLTNLTIVPNSVKGGNSTTGTVFYNVPAGVGGNPTSLTDNSGSILTPTTVTVPNGATQQTFNITTTAVSATATRTVTATRNGVSKVANLTLTP